MNSNPKENIKYYNINNNNDNSNKKGILIITVIMKYLSSEYQNP